jgi:hypothetical protein
MLADDSCFNICIRRRRRRPWRENVSDDIPKRRNRIMMLSPCLLLVIVATLVIRTRSFQFQFQCQCQSTVYRLKRLETTTGDHDVHFRNRFESPKQLHRPFRARRTIDSPFIITRFAEPRTKSLQEKEIETEITSNSSSSSSSSLSNLDEDGVVNGGNNTNATNNENLNESGPFFANIDSNATTELSENFDETNANLSTEREQELDGTGTRRDAFRYGTILTGAVWITGLTFTQTDPSSKTLRAPITKSSTIQSPRLEPSKNLRPPITQSSTIQSRRLEPVNLTKVASQTNINVTMNCEKMCVSIDSNNFRFNKVERAKIPDWLPRFLAPKSQVVKKIPNSELLVAATAAGSVTEMLRTSLLYPLQTVKIRIQADRNVKFTDKKQQKHQPLPSLSEQLETLVSNIQQKLDDGDLYAGISPTLLVSVPATGIYYGVRDVTKRMLFMTPLDSTWIAVGGALVGDVVSLCFRVPSDALAIRLQAQNDATGDWLGDSFKRLSMVILTDLPYLLSKIVLNKLLIQGDLSVTEYAGYAFLASVVAGFLTTPFDVARTRILLDKWSVVSEEEEEEYNESLVAQTEQDREALTGNPIESTSENLSAEPTTPDNIADTINPGDSVLRTMIQITKEGDGGIGNLFSGWLERVVYLGIGRAWLEPIQLIGYIGIRDAVLLEWF